MAVWEPVFKMWPMRPQPCETSGWMYAVDDNWHGLRSIGFCMSWEDRVARAQADIAQFGTSQQKMLDKCKPLQHKFHEIPHSTKEDAIECYREYLFDLSTHLTWHKRGESTASTRECAHCTKPSNLSAFIFGTSTQSRPIYFCDKHSTREEIRQGFYKAFWIGDVTGDGPVWPQGKTCSCSSRILFNQGCQCGGS